MLEAQVRRIEELDGLRAIAILLVLGCHYEGFSQLGWRIPEFGWIGVDLFFCLSGYLITSILLGLRGSSTPYRTFYARRLIRILPPYLFLLAFLTAQRGYRHELNASWLGVQLLFLQAFHLQQLSAVWGLFTHPNWHLHHLPSLLTRAGHLAPAQDGAPLTAVIVPYILWSLSIEEYFYLLWAPIVLRLSEQAVASAGVAICLLELLLRWTASTAEVYYGAIYRFDALLYGAFLALALNRWSRSCTPQWLQRFLVLLATCAGTVLLLILLAVRPILGFDPRSSPLVLVFGLPTLSIFFTAIIGLLILRSGSGWWLGRALRLPILQFVGTISYAMYLVHLPAAAMIRHLFRVSDSHKQTLVQAILSTLLTILMAQTSWLLFEKRLLRWKDRRFRASPRRPVTLHSHSTWNEIPDSG